MNLIHDAIKIQYTREGYLPNWPYHLISDSEMCDAFMFKKADGTLVGFFADNYPNVNDDLKDVYDTLVSEIEYHLNILKSSDDSYVLPDWIYAYMLGNVISVNSSILDIHDLLVMLNADNLDDVFTPAAALACYEVSKSWVGKLSEQESAHRPPTCFGEPHVIKSLRLLAASELATNSYEGA